MTGAGLEPLLELAGQAFREGIDSVHVGFDYLDADTPNPYGWFLTLQSIRRSGDGIDIDMLRVAAEPGTLPQAWTGPGQEPLDVAAVRAWITEHAAGLDNAEKAGSSADVDLLRAAVQNGWTFTREVRHHERQMMRATLGGDFPLAVSFQASAVTHFFNQEGHRAHRSTGAAVSYNVAFGRDDIWHHRFRWALIDSEQVSVDDVLAALHQPAPWHVPVTPIDDDDDELP